MLLASGEDDDGDSSALAEATAALSGSSAGAGASQEAMLDFARRFEAKGAWANAVQAYAGASVGGLCCRLPVVKNMNGVSKPHACLDSERHRSVHLLSGPTAVHWQQVPGPRFLLLVHLMAHPACPSANRVGTMQALRSTELLSI